MKQALFLLLTALTLFTQTAIAEENIYTLRLNKTVAIKGLKIKLIHHQGYEPMSGTSAVFEVEYEGRKDLILNGIAACEPDLESVCYWQGYTFRITNPKAKYTGALKVEIVQQEVTTINGLLKQESLQTLYQKIKDLMEVAENQPGNKQMNITKTKEQLINVNYQFGWRYPKNKWEKQFTERLEIMGSDSKGGCRFTLLKNSEGKVTIKSGPTANNEAGILRCLKWVNDQITK